LILERGEAIPLERLQDVPDMLARQLQTGGDALLMPALVAHPDHRPPALIGILELMEQGDGQRELDWDGGASEEALDPEVMGLVPVLALNEPSDLSIVNAGIELLGVEDVAGHDSWIAVPPRVGGCALVDLLYLPLFHQAGPINESRKSSVFEIAR
jgi:hypothetical protein